MMMMRRRAFLDAIENIVLTASSNHWEDKVRMVFHLWINFLCAVSSTRRLGRKDKFEKRRSRRYLLGFHWCRHQEKNSLDLHDPPRIRTRTDRVLIYIYIERRNTSLPTSIVISSCLLLGSNNAGKHEHIQRPSLSDIDRFFYSKRICSCIWLLWSWPFSSIIRSVYPSSTRMTRCTKSNVPMTVSFWTRTFLWWPKRNCRNWKNLPPPIMIPNSMICIVPCIITYRWLARTTNTSCGSMTRTKKVLYSPWSRIPMAFSTMVKQICRFFFSIFFATIIRLYCLIRRAFSE